ncbi:hypothetical protein CGCSCA4_v005455 [Colletotrichum siamense]|uniref:C2H2-type domain-containing protein n=1 Tax=Colletotrichum siamense TaxID=690259 RepID=A0A9P5EVH0_COLSI|nr:hypothetical protein CGCSCA4_v005455 [Colletotrichum siamense]KAF4860179.1 hypothetical protein CGCSCA2_v005502 [Colletotrichum siamense]
MASNPPRITPIPIPVPGHAPSPQSAPATSATKVLNSTAANRNASPSSVSSAGEDPARKMKRTSAKVNVKPGAFLQAPPWAASLLSSKPSTSTSTGPLAPPVPNLAPPTQDHSMVLDSPEPIRIESDILPPNPEGPVKSEFSPEDTPLEDVTPAKPSLSMSSKIQALDQSWQAQSTSADSQGSEEIIRRVSSGDVQPSRSALNWTQALQAKTQALQAKRKQPSGLPGGDSKRRLTENGVGSGSEDTTAYHGSSRQSMPASTSAEPTSSAKPGFIPIKRQPQSVSSSDDNGMLDDDSTDSDSDSEPDAPVQLDSGNADPPPRPLKVLPSLYGRPENELTTTNDGDRLYCQWKGENTPLEASCGALLPTGYTLHSDPEYPFICPDRVCRSIFRSIQGLGKHFGARHRNTMYNDNLDGTVSAVSFFDIPGTTRASPVIVSRNPLQGDEPPMPEPQTTVYKPYGSKVQAMSSAAGMPQSQPLSQPLSQPQPQTTATRTTRSHASPYSTLPDHHELAQPSYFQSAKSMTLLEYLTSQLSPTYRLPAERPDFKALLKLPMARHFPPQWTMKHSGVGNLAPLTALSLLVFLTGDPAPVSCSTCNGPDHDAFENTLRPCIVLSSRAPSWLKETVNEACASCQWRCNYKRQKVQCDFLPAFRGRTLTALPSPAPAATPTPIPPPAIPPSSAPPSYSLPRNAKFPYGGPAGDNQSGVNSPALRSPAITTPPVGTTPVNTSRPSNPPRRVTRHSAATKTASDSAPASTSSTKPAAVAIVPPNAGQTMPAELLDMEEWEIAPGRVRDDQSQEPTNVAFSNAYLTSNQAVSVSEDIAFNVIAIKPGGSHHWTDEEDKVRICSVAVGKVKVKLYMTDPFQIGPNGMFKLKPGTSCSIENRTYIDAIIHVTSVTLY